jgi:hypothetical protein
MHLHKPRCLRPLRTEILKKLFRGYLQIQFLDSRLSNAAAFNGLGHR